MADQQTYATHRQWVPLWHYIALPIATINVFVVGVRVFKDGINMRSVWGLLFAIAFFAVAYLSRQAAITVQNRLIRLEERLRMKEILPAALVGRVGELSVSQLIGLRFASDAELAGLVERCLGGELKNAEQVKKVITTWRPDTLRT